MGETLHLHTFRKPLFLLSSFTLLLISATFSTSALAITSDSLGSASGERLSDKPAYAPNQMLIQFKDGVSSRTKQSFRKNRRLARLEKVRPNLELVRTQTSTDLQLALRAVRDDPRVEHTEHNSYYYLHEKTPNDPQFVVDNQWSLHNSGKKYYPKSDDDTPSDAPAGYGASVKDADIDAEEAWDITTGSTDVTVAVVDSGVAYNHPDLKNNIWRNPGEIGSGKEGNGVDDDGNGYVDDYLGWDFTSNDNRPLDPGPVGHGTLVSGVIGAEGNNGNRMTGVNWDVNVMPLRTFIAGGFSVGTDVGIMKAIDYAGENGARVVNMSFGTPDVEFASALLRVNAEVSEYSLRCSLRQLHHMILTNLHHRANHALSILRT